MFIIIIAIVVVLALLICCCLLSEDDSHSKNTSPSEGIEEVDEIEIIPEFCYLMPSEEKIFEVRAINSMGEEIVPRQIQWQALGGAIDSQGNLIVDPQSKGTFHVTATSRIDRLTCSASYTVLPKLTSIEIITTKEIVIPGQEVYLELRGTDQTQAEINIEGQPIWSTTTGSISSNLVVQKTIFSNKKTT